MSATVPTTPGLAPTAGLRGAARYARWLAWTTLGLAAGWLVLGAVVLVLLLQAGPGQVASDLRAQWAWQDRVQAWSNAAGLTSVAMAITGYSWLRQVEVIAARRDPSMRVTGPLSSLLGWAVPVVDYVYGPWYVRRLLRAHRLSRWVTMGLWGAWSLGWVLALDHGWSPRSGRESLAMFPDVLAYRGAGGVTVTASRQAWVEHYLWVVAGTALWAAVVLVVTRAQDRWLAGRGAVATPVDRPRRAVAR